MITASSRGLESIVGKHYASIFQKAMGQILQGLDGVIIFLDDILISASRKDEHMQRLNAVLTRLEEYGLTVKQSKCKFLQTQFTYLGHVISEHGISPSQDKLQGIRDAPTPRNVTELKSFLGLLQYGVHINSIHVTTQNGCNVIAIDELPRQRTHNLINRPPSGNLF